MAHTYIPLSSPAYDYLRVLEAEGLITTAQMGTLPFSRREGARLTAEAMENAGAPESPVIRMMLRKLKVEFADELGGATTFIKPVDEIEARYHYSDSASFFEGKNRDNRPLNEGSTGSVALTARLETPHLGAVIQPEFSENAEAAGTKLNRAYGLITAGREEFLIGKDSMWWGPGRNGSILLSNNAEPFSMLRVSNSIPYNLFGLFRGSFFITQLESERDYKNAILYGIRLNFKPSPHIEFGLSKTAIFGGRGRKETFKTFTDSLTGKGENSDTASAVADEPGDQRAGFDVKVIIPWERQPFVLYFDGAGEDESNNFPSKWATIWGLYMPRLFFSDRTELTAEHAVTKVSGHPGVWYNHHIYTTGYTYKGRIIGHYIGSDANDLFVNLRYRFDTASLSLSYERMKKDAAVTETWSAGRIAVEKELSNALTLDCALAFTEEAESGAHASLGFRYRF